MERFKAIGSVLQAAALVVFGCALAAPAKADLTITNPSFETEPVGGLPIYTLCPAGNTTCYNNVGMGPDNTTAVPGWTIATGIAGELAPGMTGSNPSADIFDYIPNGNNVLYVGPGSVDQSIGTIPNDIGDTLILGVYVGDAEGIGTESTYYHDIDLIVNGTENNFATGTNPTVGMWSLWTVSVPITAGNVGDSLELVLAETGSRQTAFYDDVTDSFVLTPEPGFYGVLAIGLAGLAFAVKRRSSASRS